MIGRYPSNESKKREPKNEPLEKQRRKETEIETVFKADNYTRKTGKGIILLHNITFEVPKQKLVALLGLSGEGKSTLFDSIAGRCDESHHTYGSILVETKSGKLAQRDVEEWVKRVNYHNQEVTQYKNIPVYTLLLSVAKCYGKPKRLVDKLLTHFRVSKTRHSIFEKISGGEKKRIMTIIGIISEKEVNLWDEPLTGLDSEIAKKTLRFMKETNTTNIVSIHQPSKELIDLFDWIIFMHLSTVVYSGPASKIKEYFQEKGIFYTEDLLFVNYLMRLSADNPENEVDSGNIQRLKRITEEILKKPLSNKTRGNIFLTKSYSVRAVRVKEILLRSIYYNAKFPGSSILTEILYYLFWLVVFLLICTVAERIIPDYADGLIQRILYDPLYAMTDLYKILEEKGISGTLKNIFDESITMAVNGKWLSATISFFQSKRTITFISMVSLFSNLTNIDYFRLCKTNIEEGQFTVCDFLVAHVIEIFCRKFITSFVFSLISYYIAYNSLAHEEFEQFLLPIHLDIFLVCLITSFILSIYVVIIQFMPISSKLYLYIGGILVLLTNSIVHQLQTLELFLDSNAAELIGRLINGNLDLNSMPDEHLKSTEHPFYTMKFSMLEKKEFFIDKLAESLEEPENSWFKQAILTVTGSLLKLFYRAGPFVITEELLTKLRIYRNTIYSIEGTDELANKLEPLRSLGNLNKFEMIEQTKAISFIRDLENPLEFHEIFQPLNIVEKVTLFDILFSIARVLVLPAILLVLFGVCRYRQLQPKIRS